MSEDDKKVDRREYLRDSARSLGRGLFELFNMSAANTLQKVSGGKRYLRPPGAIDETAFLLSCNRCGRCAEACGPHAIQLLGPEAGAAIGTPYIDPFQQACLLELNCMKACDTGALSLISDPRQVKMGKAVLNANTCWAHQDIPCDVCYQRCPYPNEALVMLESKPYINPQACTGCGLCAYVCVNTPSSITIEPNPQR